MAMLKKGNQVNWRGTWGNDAPQDAIVTEIEVWKTNNKTEVDEIDWDLVTIGRDVVVTLDNGRWAYGFQISPK